MPEQAAPEEPWTACGLCGGAVGRCGLVEYAVAACCGEGAEETLLDAVYCDRAVGRVCEEEA